jgi:predicted transcriptional regulator
MLLLEIIRNEHPQSVTELARRTGREKSNLSRTLGNMERFGLVEMKNEKRRKVPSVTFDRLQFEFALGAGPRDSQAA